MQLAQPLPPPLLHEQGKDQTTPLPDYFKRMRDAHESDLRKFKFQDNRDAYEQILRYADAKASVPLTFANVHPDVFAKYAAQFPKLGTGVATAILALEVSIVIVGNVWIHSEYIFPAIRNWIEAMDGVLPVFAQLLRLMPNSESKMEKRLTQADVSQFLGAVRALEEATLTYAICARLLGVKLGKSGVGAWTNMEVDLQATTDPFVHNLQTTCANMSPSAFQAMCSSMGFAAKSAKALFSGVTGYIGPILRCMLKAGAVQLVGSAISETINTLGANNPVAAALTSAFLGGAAAAMKSDTLHFKAKTMVNTLRGSREEGHSQDRDPNEFSERKRLRAKPKSKTVGTKFNPPIYGRQSFWNDDPYSAPPQNKPKAKKSQRQPYDSNGYPLSTAKKQMSSTKQQPPQYDPQFDATGNMAEFAQQLQQQVQQLLPKRAPPRQTVMHTVLNEATGKLGTQVLGNYWGDQAAANAESSAPGDAAMLGNVQQQLMDTAQQRMQLARQVGTVGLDVATQAYDKLQAAALNRQMIMAEGVKAATRKSNMLQKACAVAGFVAQYYTSGPALTTTQAAADAVKSNAGPIVGALTALASAGAALSTGGSSAMVQLSIPLLGAAVQGAISSGIASPDVSTASGMAYTVHMIMDYKLQIITGLLAKLPVIGLLACLDPIFGKKFDGPTGLHNEIRDRALHNTGYQPGNFEKAGHVVSDGIETTATAVAAVKDVVKDTANGLTELAKDTAAKAKKAADLAYLRGVAAYGSATKGAKAVINTTTDAVAQGAAATSDALQTVAKNVGTQELAEAKQSVEQAKLIVNTLSNTAGYLGSLPGRAYTAMFGSHKSPFVVFRADEEGVSMFATEDNCKRLAKTMSEYATKAYAVYNSFSFTGMINYITALIYAGWQTFIGWISAIYGYIGATFSWILSSAQAFATSFIGLLQTFASTYLYGACWLAWGAQLLVIGGLAAAFLYFYAYPLMKWLMRRFGKAMQSMYNFLHDPKPWNNPEYEQAFKLHLREHLREPLQSLKRLAVRNTPIEFIDLNILRSAIEHALATNPRERAELLSMRSQLDRNLRFSNTQVFTPFPATGAYVARPLTTYNGR